jgi:hypothetical protein
MSMASAAPARRAFQAFVWMGLALALASLAVGVYHAMVSSVDFQWSPARLLWQGVNPFEYGLRPQHPDIILTQVPAYGHLLYILLWPYAMLDWPSAKGAWMLSNLSFLAGGLGLLWCTLPNDGRRQFVFASLLLCIGFAARNVLANGQHTLLLFFALTVFLIYRDRPLVAGVALAVVLTKYSFGLQVALLALLLGQYRVLAIAVGLNALGVVAFGALCGSGGLDLLLAPVRVARVVTAIGCGDLLSLGRRLSGGDPFGNTPLVLLSAAVNLGYFAWLKTRLRGIDTRSLDTPTVALLLAGSLYLSLGTAYHLKYDYVLVLFGLYAFIARAALRPTALLGLIGLHFLVFWTLPRFDSLFGPGPMGTGLVAFMIGSFIFMAFFCMRTALSGPEARARSPLSALAT